jgi:hypothetical protein
MSLQGQRWGGNHQHGEQNQEHQQPREKERQREGYQWKQEGHHGSKDQKSDHQGEGRVE